jgi:hypothetical protein
VCEEWGVGILDHKMGAGWGWTSLIGIGLEHYIEGNEWINSSYSTGEELCDAADYLPTPKCAVGMSVLINLRKDKDRITTKDSNRQCFTR